MEVEVKIRLLTREAHDKLVSLLERETANCTKEQSNFFIDTPASHTSISLESQKRVFRIRKTITLRNKKRADEPEDGERGVKEEWRLTIKGNATLADGISRVEEEEECIDPHIAYAIIQDPSRIFELAPK